MILKGFKSKYNLRDKYIDFSNKNRKYEILGGGYVAGN